MPQETRGGRRVLVILMWVVSVFLAVGIGSAGLAKFITADRWRTLFVGWGYPGWFSPLVGLAEIVGAVGLLVPSLALRAAMLLAVIMASAFITLLLHRGGQLGAGAAPAIYFAMLLGIAVARFRMRRVAEVGDSSLRSE